MLLLETSANSQNGEVVWERLENRNRHPPCISKKGLPQSPTGHAHKSMADSYLLKKRGRKKIQIFEPREFSSKCPYPVVVGKQSARAQ
ncbi:hypothetical protein CDAR_472801 [Caerostris darwini]|uniref:Uncharacterized protein n=1 Tax=Caerostris darwini TaxID=1538125 RepID=A0AAV4V8Q1_9ARAC|nr:hypothetical protein CDAR_472801 [Caerostris darwini]